MTTIAVARFSCIPMPTRCGDPCRVCYHGACSRGKNAFSPSALDLNRSDSTVDPLDIRRTGRIFPSVTMPSPSHLVLDEPVFAQLSRIASVTAGPVRFARIVSTYYGPGDESIWEGRERWRRRGRGEWLIDGEPEMSRAGLPIPHWVEVGCASIQVSITRHLHAGDVSADGRLFGFRVDGTEHFISIQGVDGHVLSKHGLVRVFSEHHQGAWFKGFIATDSAAMLLLPYLQDEYFSVGQELSGGS